MCAFVIGTDGARAAMFHGTPGSIAKVLRQLKAGDTLELGPGLYQRALVLHGTHGTRAHPVIVRGSLDHRTVFLAQPHHNTISIANAAYIEIHDLVLDGRGLNVDAVKAEGPSRFAHHITLDGLVIFGYDADQQNVGISTKSPAWAWTVRNCIIDSAGTGMYFGQSDGSAPFFDGLIEHNVVLDTRGYNIEIKHQKRWPRLSLDGPRKGTTIIRYNVFSKARNGSHGRLARPNVLVDHWPEAGKGKDDMYQIYGNFFYQNPTERLFQGEGNIALYDNLFVNDFGDAVSIQHHHGPAKRIAIFDNTVVALGAGVLVGGVDRHYRQRVFDNAVFAALPLRGGQRDRNFTDAYARARRYLADPEGDIAAPAEDWVNSLQRWLARDKPMSRRRPPQAMDLASPPAGQPGHSLDLYPRKGRLREPDPRWVPPPYVDADQDFNGNPRRGRFAGAYAGEGINPGWHPVLGPMPVRAGGNRDAAALADGQRSSKFLTDVPDGAGIR